MDVTGAPSVGGVSISVGVDSVSVGVESVSVEVKLGVGESGVLSIGGNSITVG